MKQLRTLGILGSTLLASGLWAGCSAPDSGGDGDGGIDLGSSGGNGGGIDVPTGGGVSGGLPWPGPSKPVVQADAPAGVEGLFAGEAAGAACITEPQDGTLIPRNWLRPRFRVAGTATAYMVTLQSEDMAEDLVAYAGPSGFMLPQDYWLGIASKASTKRVSVTATVRAHDGVSVTEAVSTFVIAPADAGGAMVYWGSNQSKDNVNASALYGFTVGEETSPPALTPADVNSNQTTDIRTQDSYVLKSNAGGEWSDPTGASPGGVSCIGCHTSTPDGKAVAFNDGFPWAGITASIEEGSVGKQAEGVSEMGARLLKTPFIGTITFSGAHWAQGDRKAVSTLANVMPYNNVATNLNENADLIWINLEAAGSADLSSDPNGLFGAQMGTGWGVIARGGDTRAAVNPNWSPDGATIAYTSAQRAAGSHVGGIQGSTVPKSPDTELGVTTEADIYTVPFANGAGGTAAPLAGAAEPGIAEYYPDYSPDGSMIAFNRAGSTQGYIYYRRDGEINVIPSAGGTATRIVANDPPQCTGEASPGVINSWPKWGPSITANNGDTYYWLVFSSARKYPEQFPVPVDYYTPTTLDTRSSQLYLAGVVKKADGTIESFPGIYVWNQTTDTSNLTPAWDEFKIPPATVR